MGDALLAWVIAVGEGQFSVAEFSDLCDGVALVDITSRISPQTFDDSGFNRTTDGNWLLKATNIKILIAQLTQVYNNVLKRDCSSLVGQIDANAIAKNGDIDCVKRLVELVLGAAVQCEGKDQFIKVIMAMEPQDQQALMGLIQTQMTGFPSLDQPVAPEPTPISPSEHRESFSDELREELEALQMEHARLQEEHDQLQEECDGKVDTLQAKVNEFKADAHDLKVQLRERDAQAEDLQIDLESQQQQLESREEQLKKLRKQMEEKDTQNDNQGLLDELDVLRDKLQHAQKNEAMLAKAKKKLEDMSDLQTQVTSLEQQNAMLLQERDSLSKSTAKAGSVKANLDGANSQIADMEQQITDLTQQVAAVQQDLQTAQDAQRSTLAENQSLKTSNLELQQEIALNDDDSGTPLGMQLGGDLMSGFGEAENSAALAEQQAIVAQLQQENESLKATIAATASKDAGAEADRMQESAAQQAEAQREITKLTEQLAITDGEVVRLKEAYTKAVQVCQTLKTRLQDTTKQSGEVGAEKLAELQEMVNSKETQVQDLEERACGAERELQSKGTEMRALEDDLSFAREENEGLRNRLTELSSQNEMAQRQLADSASAGSTDESAEMSAHKQTIASMQVQLTEQEKNLANTKQQLEETTKLKDHEIKLVSTAFYEVGLELQKRWKSPQVGKTWLSKKRQQISQERRIMQ